MQHSLLEVSEVSFTPVPPAASYVCYPHSHWSWLQEHLLSLAPVAGAETFSCSLHQWHRLGVLHCGLTPFAGPVSTHGCPSSTCYCCASCYPLTPVIHPHSSVCQCTGVIGADHSQIADSIANLGFHLFPTRGKALSRQGRWTFQ